MTRTLGVGLDLLPKLPKVEAQILMNAAEIITAFASMAEAYLLIGWGNGRTEQRFDIAVTEREHKLVLSAVK